jgi:thiol-disulfide isomerase/thioredoxin
MPIRPANESDETWIDKVLSERVLYPILGLVLVLVVTVIVVRRPNHGPAPTLDLPVVTVRGEPGTERVNLRDLRGHVVLLDFWATWCAPCRVMTPVLGSLHRRFERRGLMVIGVNVDEEGPRVVQPFRETFGIEYPLVYDMGGVTSRRFHVSGLPTMVLIDRDGNVRYRHAGTLDESTLATIVEGLL